MNQRIKRAGAKIERKLANASLRSAGSFTGLNVRQAYETLERRPFAFSDADLAKIGRADVVSFDLFETLIFRDFDDPKVVFDLCGLQLNFQGFREARVCAERELRRKKTGEVTLDEIYSLLERRYGIDKKAAMETEFALEYRHCVPNRRMAALYREILDKCRSEGRKCIITSDMYLPEEMIVRLLEKCGIGGYDALFLSSSIGMRKADGSLYRYIREQFGEGLSYVHIGDSVGSDIEQAKKQGFEAIHYPDITREGISAGKLQVNRVTGGVYCSLVNRALLAGMKDLTESAKFGYTYFGIIVYGYCRWLHGLRARLGADTIYFAARDMKVVYEVYTRLFPEDTAVYIAASRLAMLKAGFPKTSDMFLKNVEDALKAEPDIEKAFRGMKIECLLPLLAEKGIDTGRQARGREAVERVCQTLRKATRQISRIFAPEREAATAYFRELPCSSRILFADLNGRATSTIVTQDLLEEMGRHCDVICAQMYTTTQGELFDSRSCSRDIVTWLFSMDLNRYHRHVFSYRWARNAAVLEAVFTEDRGTLLSYIKDERGELLFGERPTDGERIREVHEGIRAFAADFDEAWRGISKTGEIDTYLPYVALTGALGDAGRQAKISLTMGN